MEGSAPAGPGKLESPRGTEEGKLVGMKGGGVPKRNGAGVGDVLARIRSQVPKKVNKKQREALEALQQAGE